MQSREREGGRTAWKRGALILNANGWRHGDTQAHQCWATGRTGADPEGTADVQRAGQELIPCRLEQNPDRVLWAGGSEVIPGQAWRTQGLPPPSRGHAKAPAQWRWSGSQQWSECANAGTQHSGPSQLQRPAPCSRGPPSGANPVAALLTSELVAPNTDTDHAERTHTAPEGAPAVRILPVRGVQATLERPRCSLHQTHSPWASSMNTSNIYRSDPLI